MVKYKPALLFKPNSTFNYSNTNFSLLALIIEKIVGKDYPTFIKESIFTALGMKNTFVMDNTKIQHSPGKQPRLAAWLALCFFYML